MLVPTTRHYSNWNQPILKRSNWKEPSMSECNQVVYIHVDGILGMALVGGAALAVGIIASLFAKKK